MPGTIYGITTNTLASGSARAFVPLALLLSNLVWAQTLSELDNLIFEPVPLSAIRQAPAGQGQQAGAETSSGELTGPPQAAFALSAGGLPPQAFTDDARLARASLHANPRSTLLRGAETDASSPLADRESAASLEVYREVIEEMETEDGPYTPELAQELMALGELYQRQGEHEKALDAFARAGQLARINSGLWSLEQVPGIENMIESLIALGEIREANDKHAYLVYLHERHYGRDDPRILPALLRLADWQMQAFDQGVRFEAEGMLISVNDATTEKDVRRSAFGNLFRAQTAYLRSLQILVEEGEFRDPRLVELERALIENYFLFSHRENLVDDPYNYLHQSRTTTGSRISYRSNRSNSPAYRFGKDAYSRIMAYQLNDPNATVEQYAGTLLELGDWHLLYGRRTLGLKKYEEALEILREAGYQGEEMDVLLHPEIPVTLPVFTPTPHTRAMLAPGEELEYRGYIDLSFSISRFGHAQDILTLGKSPQTSLAVERRLTRLVRQSQFRPRLGDGRAGEDAVALRYYYTY